MKRTEGFFITAEGLDGSGKTTQIGFIRDFLAFKGYEVLVVREPGGTAISERIRELVLDPAGREMSPVAEMLLYAASRAQLVEQVIRPSLDRGDVVVCDRFYDSSIAYQGFGRGLDVSMIAEVNRTVLRGLTPDLTFFFDLQPQVSIERRSMGVRPQQGSFSGAADLDRIEMEQMDFHTRVYEGFKWLAGNYPDRIRVIDASADPDTVSMKVRAWLDRYFPD